MSVLLSADAHPGTTTINDLADALGTCRLPDPDRTGSTAAPKPARPAGPALDAATDLILGHPAVVDARIFTAASEEGDHHTVAYVATLHRGLRPRDLYDLVMNEVTPTSRIVCPHQFVIVTGLPQATGDRTTWHRLPTIAVGNGRERGRWAPRTDPARALHHAVANANANGLESIPVSASYLQAGGRLVLAPSIVHTLRATGYSGLEPDDFTLPASLTSLAARLTRIGGC